MISYDGKTPAKEKIKEVLDEIDKIIEDVRTDKVSALKSKNKGLQMRLEHLASLEDCDEEFEM